jgi:hypothetical protein
VHLGALTPRERPEHRVVLERRVVLTPLGHLERRVVLERQEHWERQGRRVVLAHLEQPHCRQEFEPLREKASCRMGIRWEKHPTPG